MGVERCQLEKSKAVIAGGLPAKHTKQKQKPSDRVEQFMPQVIKVKKGDVNETRDYR